MHTVPSYFERRHEMKNFKSTFCSLLFFLMLLIPVTRATAQFNFIVDDILVPQLSARVENISSIERKTHYIPGGICYTLREGSIPDVTTFVTATVSQLNATVISSCLRALEEEKFVRVMFPNRELPLDFLFEARTEMITCSVIGITQYPVLYQIRVLDKFVLASENSQLTECIAKAHSNPSVIKPPRSDFKSK